MFPNVPPDVAYEIFADLRIRKKWDHRLAQYHLLEVTNDYQVHYNKLMKIPIPFLNQRDRVVKQHLHKYFPKNGTHISVHRSCTHPDFPENYDGCIRTDTQMVGYLFDPMPEINGTKMHWIYIDNLKGSIPGELV